MVWGGRILLVLMIVTGRRGSPISIANLKAPFLNSPSLPEVLLGIGGIGIALLMVTVAVKVLRFLPESLADSVVDPHAPAAKG